MTLSRLAGSRVMTSMDPEVERSIVGRLRAGETDAFDEVYDAYRPRIFAFLLRMSRSRSVAEDLLDEAWLRLVRVRARSSAGYASWTLAVHRGTQSVLDVSP